MTGIQCFRRGGFAIDSDKLSELKVSTTLYLYQAGFTLGSAEKNWHPYSRKSMVRVDVILSKKNFSHLSQEFLKALDSGILPPFISEMLKHAKWTFYDGELVYLDVVSILELNSMNHISYANSVCICKVLW